MHITIALLFFAISCSSRVAHQNDPLVPLQRWTQKVSLMELTNQGWKVGKSDLSQKTRLTISLKRPNMPRVTEVLRSVSFPNSPKYGQFLSHSEVTALVAPPRESINTVSDFLRQHNVSFILKSHDSHLECDVPGSLVEIMFQTKLQSLHHTSGRFISFHTLHGLDMPRKVADLVQHVSGISTGIPKLLEVQTASTQPPSFDMQYIKNWYYVPLARVPNGNQATQAVVELGDNSYDPADLAQFFATYSTINIGKTPQVKGTGTNNPQTNPSREAALDIQLIMGMAPNSSTSFYVYPPGKTVADALVDINNNQNPEKVISVSYGSPSGAESEADLLDQELQVIGLKGVTVVLASGDYGVNCVNGVNQPDIFASPYALLVSQTDIVSGQGEIGRDVSGGGFSNYFPTADFQTAEVAHFLTNASPLPPSSQYNSTGRGYPDLSALGTTIDIIYQGQTVNGAGSSAAAPIVAGIITNLNGVRIAAGKPTLGWFNPLLYQIHRDYPQKVISDVIGGPYNNDNHTACQGFAPQPGWDPVTGLGNLLYAPLADVINNY